MGLVRFGAGIIQISGSIGGTTFARNRSGNYARARTVPTNPKTDRQVTIRAAIAFLADRWAQTLTGAQRTAWNLYADSLNMKNRIGEVIHLSGYNHYIRSNAIRKQTAIAIIDDGPVVFELPAQDPTFAVTASEATQLLDITYDDGMDWADENGGFFAIFGGQPQNAQRNFFAGPWRYGNIVVGVNGAPPALPFNFASPFAVAELQHVWAYARILRADGRLSEIFRADCIVAA